MNSQFSGGGLSGLSNSSLIQMYQLAQQQVQQKQEIKNNKEAEAKEMATEKKNFGLKDATMVVFIAWIVSKLVSRWTGKTLEELLGEYKSEFKEWLNK